MKTMTILQLVLSIVLLYLGFTIDNILLGFLLCAIGGWHLGGAVAKLFYD